MCSTFFSGQRFQVPLSPEAVLTTASPSVLPVRFLSFACVDIIYFMSLGLTSQSKYSCNLNITFASSGVFLCGTTDLVILILMIGK